MPSQNDLQFTLKMQDQASAALKAFMGFLNQTANSASKMADSASDVSAANKELDASTAKLAETTGDAAKAATDASAAQVKQATATKQNTTTVKEATSAASDHVDAQEAVAAAHLNTAKAATTAAAGAATLTQGHKTAGAAAKDSAYQHVSLHTAMAQAEAQDKKNATSSAQAAAAKKASAEAAKAQAAADKELAAAEKAEEKANRDAAKARADAAKAQQKAAADAIKAEKDAQKEFQNTVAQAKSAFGSVTAILASFGTSDKALTALGDFEAGLFRIQQATDLAGARLNKFRDDFENLGRGNGGRATVDQLTEIEVAAAGVAVSGDNLNQFAQTLLKLGVNAQGAGAQYASEFATILNITDKGTDNFAAFADEVAHVGEVMHVGVSTLIAESAGLARATAAYNVTRQELLALGAELRLVPGAARGVANSIPAIFQAFKTGGQEVDQALREIAANTGSTFERLKTLSTVDPLRVFISTLQRVQELQSKGINADGLLSELGIKGAEASRVIEELASHWQELQKGLDASGDSAGASDRLSKLVDQAYSVQEAFTDVRNSIDALFKDVGESIAPVVIPGLHGVAEVLRGLQDAFDQASAPVKTLASVALVLGPGLIGLAGAFKLLGSVATPILAAMDSGLIGLGLRIGTLAGGALAIWGLADAFAGLYAQVRRLTLQGLSLDDLGHGIAVIAGLESKQSLIDRVQKEKDDGKVHFGKDDNGDSIQNTYPDRSTDAVPEDPGIAARRKQSNPATATPGTSDAPQAAGINSAYDETKRAIDGTVQSQNILAAQAGTAYSIMLQGILKTLTPSRELNRTIAQMAELLDLDAARAIDDTNKMSAAERARAEEALVLEQRKADVIGNQLRQGRLALDLQGQITDKGKEDVEIRNALSAAQEKDGNFKNNPGQQEEVAAQVREQHATAARVALAQMNISLNEQLQIAGAIGKAEQEQLAIEQKLTEFARSHAEADAGELAAYGARLAALDRVKDAQADIAKYVPQMGAVQEYNETQKRLGEELKNHLITQEAYNRAVLALNESSLAQRDPLGAIAKDAQQQLQVLSLTGAYRETDANTIKQINDLKKEGINLDDASNADMAKAKALLFDINREMADYKKDQDSGFNGFANKVGTIKDNLSSLESDFADGLSNGISGALSGNRSAFADAGKAFGQSALKMGTNLILAEAFKGLGLAGPDKDKEAKIKSDVEKFKEIASKQVSITAQQVTVNGDLSKQATQAAQAPASSTSDGKPSTTQPDFSGPQKLVNTGGAALGQGGIGSDVNAPLHTSSKTGTGGANVALNDTDIDHIARVAYTETANGLSKTNPDQFNLQRQGVVDTILNRQSAHYGGASTTDDVLNAKRQFSKITGPESLHPYGSVENTPEPPDWYKAQIRQDILSRAAGTRNDVTGGGQQYLNPSFSDAGSLEKWGNNVVAQGRGYGVGNQTQYYGTAPGVKAVGGYQIAINGAGQQIRAATGGPSPATRGGEQTVIGDSIGLGVKNNLNAGGAAFVGANPQQVLNEIANVPGSQYAGSGRIGLSSGISNNISDLRGVQQQFDELKKKGVDASRVDLYGVGNRSDFQKAGINDQLSEIAKRNGANFTGGINPNNLGADGVHPKDYAAFTKQIDDSAAHFKTAFTPAIDSTAKQLQSSLGDATKEGVDRTPTGSVNPAASRSPTTTGSFPSLPTQNPVTGAPGTPTGPDSNGDAANQLGSGITGLGLQGLADAAPGAAPYLKLLSPLLKPLESGLSGGLSSLFGGASSAVSDGASALSGAAASGGDFFSSIFSAFGFLHGGGVVGAGNPQTFRTVSPSIFTSAKKFHDGLGDDEFMTVLQRGERVLTANQDARNANAMTRLSNAVANLSTPAGTSRPIVSGQSSGGVTVNVNTPNASSFRQSSSQTMAHLAAGVSRANAKHN